MFRRGARFAPVSTGNPRRRVCALEALENRRLLSASPNPTATPALINSTSTPGVPGYTPSQVLHAYGFDTAATTIGAVGGDGSGQTIAIVEAYHSPTLQSDVQQFDSTFAIPSAPSLTEVDENGGNSLPANNTAWGLETTLDVEWAHAVSPGANIIVVEAESAQLSDLLTAVNTARTFSDVSVVSMSWGVNEFSGETAYDNILTTPAGHQPITFVAAVGDTGKTLNVQWPAASPNIVAVGGSTLTINTITTATGVVETTYSGAITGLSQYESPPAYQSPNPTSDGRTIPDVVYDASPTPGFSIYDSSQSGWQTLGGTSAGAPQWAALVAIADEVRAQAGSPTLDGFSQTLPAIYLFSGTQKAADGGNLDLISGDAAASTAISDTATSLAGTTMPTASQNSTEVNFASAATGLSLTTADGAPQATQVINALATTTTTAKKPAPPTTVPIAVIVAPLAKKTAHPFFTFVAASMPRLSAAPSSAPAVAVGGLAVEFAYRSTEIVASTSALSRSFGTSSTLNTAGPAVVVAGATTGLAPGMGTFSQAIAAIYHAFPRLGEADVVPVAEILSSDPSGVRPSFYIAHINVAATFGDAIAAFINDCAERPRSFVAVEDAPHGHLRAWVVTLGVVAVDALVLSYLSSRRQRRVGGHGVDRWWDESPGDVEVDDRVSLL